MPKENTPINLEKIAESAWGINQNVTKEKLALLFLQSIAKVKSSEELIILINIFFDPRCRLDNELIESVLNGIETFFTFELHNSPKPITSLENIILDICKNPITSKGGVHRDIFTGKDSGPSQ